MIAIANLTTSDAVRGLLGISEAELPDGTLVAAAVEEELLLDLSGWLPSSVVLADVISEGTAAAELSDDWKAYQRLAAYSKAFCAHFFVASQENWRLIKLTDGQVEETRKSSSDLEAMAKALLGLMAKHREALLSLVEPTTPAPTRVTLMGSSRPSYDPVTG